MPSEATIDKNENMTFKKGNEPVKKKLGRKPVYIHKCSEKEVLARMTMILIGNGNPEEGLVFRFNEFIADHKRVVDDISTIKGAIKEALEASGHAVRAVETYKAEMNGVEIGQGKKTAKAKLKFDTITSIIGTIVIVVALAASTYFSIKGTKTNSIKIETAIQKVDNMGTPVIVNPRGAPSILPEGDSLKFYRNGKYEDTIK